MSQEGNGMPVLKAIGLAAGMRARDRVGLFGLALLFLLFSGCGSGGGARTDGIAPVSGQASGGDGTGEPPHSIAPTAIVKIFPEDPAVTAGNKQTFKAEVTGLSPAVSWQVQEGTDGGSITPDGTYTAPPIPGTYHVVAVSQDDPASAATVEVTVVVAPVVSVAIEPAAATLSSGKSLRFIATVSGSDDVTATWSLQEGDAGGLIQPDGTYTAPAAAGIYHLIAASQADPAKNATATVTVTSESASPEPVLTPRFAYVANSISNDVTMHTIDPVTGALTRIGAIAAGKEPYTITVDPLARFVYAGNFGSNTISMYSIDPATGALTSTGTVETGIGPYSLTIDPTGRFAYAANENSSTDVWVYRIDQTTGVLNLVQTASAGMCPIGITVDPSGRFAYVANNCSNNVSMYHLDPATGALTFIGNAAAGSATNAVAVHPKGFFAYVANYGSNDVWAYRVDPATGALTKIGQAAAGTHPFTVTVEPSGRFVYVGNSDSSDISMYQIDLTTGLLKPLGKVKGGAAPRSITPEPTGRFLYASTLNSNDVSLFRIDAASGLLTLVGNYPAGNQSRAVRVASMLQ